MKENIIKSYLEKIRIFDTELKNQTKKNNVIALCRGAVFIAGTVFTFYITKHIGAYSIFVAIFFLFPLLLLIQWSSKIKSKIRFYEELVKINSDEIDAINGKCMQFYSGQEFVNYDHFYTYDLDIFGNGSIFQFLNRTCTKSGRLKLANFLMFSGKKKSEILNKQEAVKELGPKLDWRQKFVAQGNIMLNEDSNKKTPEIRNSTSVISEEIYLKEQSELNELMGQPVLFANKPFYKISLIVLPVLTLFIVLLVLSNVLTYNYLVLTVFVNLFLTSINLKKIDNIYQKISQKAQFVEKFEELIKSIEKEDFFSRRLIDQKNKLVTENLTASKNLKSLKNLIKAFENRLNILFAFVSNSLFLWDLQCIIRIEKWQQKFKNEINKWFDAVGEVDALNSLANLSYNYPDFIFPEITDQPMFLTMQNGGHPLILEGNRINNNFNLTGKGNFAIITGANMAGKSTFLRTIGVNLILAMAGSPVCASKFVFYPIDLFTSIRLNDSLQKNESYFYAELKRLQSIISRLKNGESLFVIIDEMLKGTNSYDKHSGSEAVIKNLINCNAMGLIATHDIQLGKLKDIYPDNLVNKRFEVEIEGDKLKFDYKLQDGISQNLNATLLMKKMGIIQ